MGKELKFLILDGYPKISRDQFDTFGVKLAGKLYAHLLLNHLPEASYDILYTSDEDVIIPGDEEIKQYAGILWPGCNLTVYHDEDERVTNMKKIAISAFTQGIPQFGSCWAAQLAVYIAGGEVKPNPKGREMGVARKIFLTEEGKKHPMYIGKTNVFDAFISHDDMITKLPEGSKNLASNDFTEIQSVEVRYKKGIFWAPQYHPEYDLHLMSGLIQAREEKLTREGYFKGHEDLKEYASQLEIIFQDPGRKDLRWKLAIDDDLISDDIRELEFSNWANHFILNTSNKD